MSRDAMWGVAAAAALLLAPAARAGDDKRGDPGQTNESAGSAGTTERGARSDTSMSQGKDVRTSSDQSAKGMSRHDNTDVIPKLYRANVTEIESAKIAEKNAQSQGVKDFAKQMERDHKEMADSLKKLADNRKLKLDDDAAKKQHQAHFDQMKNMKGAAFDQHYVHMMVSEHEKDLNDVKTALQQARQTGDNDLVSVLEKAQTTIEGHHRMAMDLERNKGASDTRQGRSDMGSSQTAPSSTRSNSSEADRAGAAGTTGTTDATGGTSHSSSSPSDTRGGSSSSSGTTTQGK